MMYRTSWRPYMVIFIIDTTAAVILEAHQTSTNGSYVAGLGFDGDLNTFSLTNDDGNQSWSASLDKPYQIAWIFLCINTGAFRLTMGLNNTEYITCVDIAKPTVENIDIIKKVFTCKEAYPSINRIKISRTGEEPLKIYDFKILGILQNDHMMYTNFTGFPNESKALDNNLNTFYQSEKQNEMSWFLRLNSSYEMKWILISIRGGDYELHITTEVTLINVTTLCRKFSFPGIKKHQIVIECNNSMTGDTVIMKKTNEGSLRLFEVYPLVCVPNHYGPSCARCSKKCRSCSPITGKCTQCPASFYGDYCQYSCPKHCLDLVCDQTTGICNGCVEGYKGDRCELEILTPAHAVTTDNDANTVSLGTTSDKSTLKGEGVFFKDTHESSTTYSLATTREFTKKHGEFHQALLICVLVLLSILLLVVIILFIKRKMWMPKDENDENVGVFFETQWDLGVSTNNLELEEIAQNETGDVEEEVVVVEYSNLTSQRVQIGQFLEDLPNRKEGGALEKEFDELPFGLLESHSNALKSYNRNRNRYRGIFPYDYNGVKLRTEYENNDNYINASYIHGFHKEKAYIAAQGPFNPRTLEDFWGMVWQNDSSRIVMLTNLYEGEKMKCLQYWPVVGHDVDIGPYTITLEGEDMYDQYTLRNLTVKYQEEVKTVTQFHFTAWPDNSVPADVTSLLFFRNFVRSDLTSSEGAVVVHCSAGIGRTGTFIALDYMLEEGAAEQNIDVKGYVISLRHQRGKCIQTREQYIFLHDALAEGLQQNNVHQQCLMELM